MFAIERRPSHGGVDRKNWIKRHYVPICSEGEAHTMIEEGAKSIGAAGAVVAQKRLSPAAIINRLVGLHRSYDFQFRKAVKIFCGHVLRMFNAQAAVTLALGFCDLAIHIDHDGDPFVAHGLPTNLPPA